MGVRETSISAYRDIRSSGLLSEKRQQVFDLLCKFAPVTAMELRSKMPEGIVDSQVRARLTELREMGVVREVGKRICEITGQRVILWDVTKKEPKKLLKKEKEKCPHCKGKGRLTVTQTRLL